VVRPWARSGASLRGESPLRNVARLSLHTLRNLYSVRRSVRLRAASARAAARSRKIEMHLIVDRSPFVEASAAITPVELAVEGMVGVQGDDELASATANCRRACL